MLSEENSKGKSHMLDVNIAIANNIHAELKKENKTQIDLVEGIGASGQTNSHGQGDSFVAIKKLQVRR